VFVVGQSSRKWTILWQILTLVRRSCWTGPPPEGSHWGGRIDNPSLPRETEDVRTYGWRGQFGFGCLSMVGSKVFYWSVTKTYEATKISSFPKFFLSVFFIWRPRDSDRTQDVSPYINHHCAQHSEDCVAQNWGEDKQRWMGRYDGCTLKKKIRDSRTDETPRPHLSTLLFFTLVKSDSPPLPTHHLRN